MERTAWRILRRYAPAPLLVIAGWVMAFAVERWLGGPASGLARQMASWLVLLGTMLGLSWAMFASWRLYLWLRGVEQGLCPCGGMLSRPRGKGQATAGRKCLACGQAVSGREASPQQQPRPET